MWEKWGGIRGEVGWGSILGNMGAFGESPKVFNGTVKSGNI